MKWKHNIPKLGDERTEIQMAWLPTMMNDGYIVWLETYRVHLKYTTRDVPTKGGYVPRTRWFKIKKESLW